MHIVDMGIIGLLVLGAFMGIRNGFTRQLVRTVGLILVLFLAFQYKDILSELMYRNLPFFSYFGFIKGIEIFNILIYELIAFFVILLGLLFGLKLILMAANIFEMLINMTIIFGLPSKILGALVGVVQYFLLIFIALYVVSLPVFDNAWIEDSELSERILTETPYLSKWTGDAYEVLLEFRELKDKYDEDEDQNQFNLDALDTFLRYNVISIESANYLVEKGKLEIDGVDAVLREYN